MKIIAVITILLTLIMSQCGGNTDVETTPPVDSVEQVDSTLTPTVEADSVEVVVPTDSTTAQ